MATYKTDFVSEASLERRMASVHIDVAVQVTPDDLENSPKSALNIEAIFELPLKKPTARLKNYQDIGEALTKAGSRVLLERRTKYDNVKVLSIYWRDGEYPEMKSNAEFIGKTFEEDFSYRVTLVELPAENPGSRLLKALGSADELRESAQKNLLILYYCGHGVWDRKGTSLKPHKDASVQLKWEKFQSILTELDCDILLIFDCCQATAMIIKDQEWKRRCEIIGATNRMDAALADRDKSFTNALQQQLQSYVSDGVAVDMLYSDLSDMETMRHYKMERQPDYQIHSDRNKWPSSIFLQPQSDPKNNSEINGNASHPRDDHTETRSLDYLIDKTDAVMLFAVILEGAHSTPRQEDWDNVINSFSLAPPNTSSIEVSAIPPESYRALMKLVKISAVFSGSCIIIMAMPVWFYSHLDPNPSYHEIAIVRSDNLWAASKAILAESYRIPDQPKVKPDGFRRRRKSNSLPRPLQPDQPFLTLEQFRSLVGMPQDASHFPDSQLSSENENENIPRSNNSGLITHVVQWFKKIFRISVNGLDNTSKRGSPNGLYASVLKKERTQWALYTTAIITKSVCQILQLLIATALITVGFTTLLAPLEEHRKFFAIMGILSIFSTGLTSYYVAQDLPKRYLQHASRLQRYREELEDRERALRAGLATITLLDLAKLQKDYEKMMREEAGPYETDIWSSIDSARDVTYSNYIKDFKDGRATGASTSMENWELGMENINYVKNDKSPR